MNAQQLPALATDWSQQPAQRPLLTRLLAVPEFKVIYDGIFRKLQDGAGATDQVIGRARSLHEFVKPWVIADQKKMYTDQQFLESLVKDTTNPAGQPGAGGGGMPPGGLPPGVPPPSLNTRHLITFVC